MTLNLTTYQRLIDSVIKMIKQDGGTADENGAQRSVTLSIWRSSTAIEAENFGKNFWGENLTEWRFHTNPVSQELPEKVYHKLPLINPGLMHLFLRGLSGGGELVNGGGYIRGGLQPVDRCITFVEGGGTPGEGTPREGTPT